MNFPRTKRSQETYVSHAVVRIESILDDGRTAGWATGFLINEVDFLSLYTCWHVATGADPHKLPANFKLERKIFRIHVMGVETPIPQVRTIGGLRTFDIELYGSGGNPTWMQGEPQDGYEGGSVPPPHWDCIRFDVSNYRQEFPAWFEPEDDVLNGLSISDDAFIVGYPFGYSANESGPDPIFIRRTPASVWGPRYFGLLDGPGAAGMSGGPIVTRINNEWRVAGIYNGVVFPEATYFESNLAGDDAKSQLPLGKYTNSKIARVVVGVNPTDMGLTSQTGPQQSI